MEVVDTTQINSFASPMQADFPVSPQITVPASMLQDLLDTVQELKEEVAALRDERAQDRAEFDRFKATHRTFAVQTGKDLDALFAATEKATRVPTPTGETTISRIAKVKDFLKARGGGATFQECERLLDIRPNQMTKLVSQLDKRSFEVFGRAGDGRQRVLRLKAQIVSRER